MLISEKEAAAKNGSLLYYMAKVWFLSIAFELVIILMGVVNSNAKDFSKKFSKCNM